MGLFLFFEEIIFFGCGFVFAMVFCFKDCEISLDCFFFLFFFLSILKKERKRKWPPNLLISKLFLIYLFIWDFS